ncbi:MAG: general secretion pathway protein GspM [Geobacter sp.]|nr:general secretion pathway protein GspM [Geobacter sp.]
MSRLKAMLNTFRDMESKTRFRIGVGIALLLLSIIAFSVAEGAIDRLAGKRRAREADLAEIIKLKARYQAASGGAQMAANRLAAVQPDDSPARVMEEIGIRGKGLQVKPLKGEETGGFQAETAEVSVDSLTANETVNLLFRLEKGNRPVVIKKAAIKTRFDDPAKLDLRLTIALLKAPAQGLK